MWECGDLGVAWGDEPYAEPATYLAAADTRERLRRPGRRLEGVDGLLGFDKLSKPGEEVERGWFRCGREVGADWRLYVFRMEVVSWDGVGRCSASGVVYL